MSGPITLKSNQLKVNVLFPDCQDDDSQNKPDYLIENEAMNRLLYSAVTSLATNENWVLSQAADSRNADEYFISIYKMNQT